MLVLSRRVNQLVIIGDNIKVMILAVIWRPSETRFRGRTQATCQSTVKRSSDAGSQKIAAPPRRRVLLPTAMAQIAWAHLRYDNGATSMATRAL